MPKVLRVSAVILALFFIGFARAGESDVAAQLAQMQEQMRAMTQKMEAQQKRIDDQDKTIAALKGVRRDIGSSPAAEAYRGKEETTSTRKNDKSTTEGSDERPKTPRHSWEMPAITVTEERPAGALREEDRIGDYNQPRWTARRRFAETREYVIPKGEIEFEYWSILETPRKTPHDDSGKEPKTTVETRYEAEIGLPYRLQLDLYANSHSMGNDKGFAFDQQSVEVRYAFANWGVIPGNPTLYAEYTFNDKPEADHYEFKLLFSGEAGKGWHWAYNQVFEHEMGGAGTNSYESTGGVSYTVKDEVFSVGAEIKLAYEDESGHRGLHKPELLAGPSFQVRPLKQMHIDFTPLAGFTKKSDQFKSLIILGWEF